MTHTHSLTVVWLHVRFPYILLSPPPSDHSLYYSYGAERFEDGASQINKSDMYFGNDEPLTVEQLRVLDEVTNAQIKYVKMNPGDVVLLDNYKTLHGRNVFDGVRKHGVAWFEGWERS